MELSKEARKALKKEGLTYASIVDAYRDSHGYPCYQIRAKSAGQWWIGWLKEGESVSDIKWYEE